MSSLVVTEAERVIAAHREGAGGEEGGAELTQFTEEQLREERDRIKGRLYAEYRDRIEQMLVDEEQRKAGVLGISTMDETSSALFDNETRQQLKSLQRESFDRLKEYLLESGRTLQEAEAHLESVLDVKNSSSVIEGILNAEKNKTAGAATVEESPADATAEAAGEDAAQE